MCRQSHPVGVSATVCVKQCNDCLFMSIYADLVYLSSSHHFHREGRAALVTSFSCFKYMALYSIIQFTTVSLLYAFASNLGDFQFLYIDLALILPIAVFMGRTEAFPVLSPKRPTANLVSKKVLTSLIGQIVIQGCFQATLFSIVRHQPWYKPPKYERGEKNIEGYENTSLF